MFNWCQHFALLVIVYLAKLLLQVDAMRGPIRSSFVDQSKFNSEARTNYGLLKNLKVEAISKLIRENGP